MLYSNLIKIMNEKDISMRDLSGKTGIALETIHRARGSKISKCRLETLEKIADILNVKVKDIFYEE